MRIRKNALTSGILFTIALNGLLTPTNTQGQSLGNAEYYSKGMERRTGQADRFNFGGNYGQNGRTVVVKGLYNVEPDAYVAVFSTRQVGESQKEASDLLDRRIDSVERAVAKNPNAELHVDMISFTPVYRYEEEKKIFSENTYKEVPKGFEIKKNLHIRYENSDYLQELVRICSGVEIYDLVKVDQFSDSLEEKKWELMREVQEMARKKVEFYQRFSSGELVIEGTDFQDEMKVIRPKESYASYQAYESSSLNLVPEERKEQRKKKSTRYYSPEPGKAYDIVRNPEVLEPVIQLSYGVELFLKVPEERTKGDEKKELVREHHYHMITPEGRIRKLDLRQDSKQR